MTKIVSAVTYFTKEDVEYSDFMRWLSNPHTSRLNCDLKEGVWTC